MPPSSPTQNNMSTYATTTFSVFSIRFIAKDIPFQNTAGTVNHQAVALKSDSDLSVFYRCGISGYKDSLLVSSNRQFYAYCKISGTVDFIFGYGAAVFQHCQILVKKGLPTDTNTTAAQGGAYAPSAVFGFTL